MNKLDATQSALVGIDADRRHLIENPKRLRCDGCGTNVYVSKPMIAPAKQSAFHRRHKLYVVCHSCAEPFLSQVASGDGEIEGTPSGIADIMPRIIEKRRQFTQRN